MTLLTKYAEGSPRLLAVGRYFLALHENPGWVKRRRQTIRFIDKRRIEREVALELDLIALRSAAEASGMRARPTLPVPLMLADKGMLIDVAAGTADGTPLLLVGHEQDSHAAEALLFAKLAALHNVKWQDISPTICRKLYEIALKPPLPEDIRAFASPEANLIEAWRLTYPDASVADQQLWDASISEPNGFSDLLSRFTLNYLPITELDSTGTYQIVRFTYLEEVAAKQRERHLRSPLPLSFPPLYFEWTEKTIGMAQRERIRVVAPEGMAIFTAGLDRADSSINGPLPATSSLEYEYRLTGDRFLIHTTRAEKGQYVISGAMTPDTSAYATPACLGVLAGFTLVVAGILGEFFFNHLLTIRLADKPEAAVALLLTPTMFANWVLRWGEHDLLRLSLIRPRRHLLYGAAATAACACTVVAGCPPLAMYVVWGASAAVLFGVLLSTFLFYRMIADAEKHINRVLGRSFTRKL